MHIRIVYIFSVIRTFTANSTLAKNLQNIFEHGRLIAERT